MSAIAFLAIGLPRSASADNTRPIWTLTLALSLCLTASTAAAEDLGRASTITVRNEAFCLVKSGRDCEEFAIDGDRLPLQSLPRNKSGERVLYFRTVQTLELGATFTHVWESGGERARRPRAKLHWSDRVRRHAAWAIGEMSGWFSAYVRTLDVSIGAFAVVVTTREGENTPAVRVEEYPAFSQRRIHGPGRHTAYSTEVGEPTLLQGSRRRTVSVVE